MIKKLIQLNSWLGKCGLNHRKYFLKGSHNLFNIILIENNWWFDFKDIGFDSISTD
jgi:hypothetical protein